MSELYQNYGVLEQPDRVNHLRRFKAWAWRGLVVAVIVAGSACARTATEQPPEPISTVTLEPSPSPTATPLAEKLLGGDLTELTAEQAANLDVWLPAMVSGLSRLAFNGFIDGKPLGAGASAEVTGWSYQGYLVNLYPVESTGVELHLQIDPESEQVALLPTIRDADSPDDGAVIVTSSTDPETWDFKGDEPVIMTPQTENGVVQWSFALETYVSVSKELEATHFVDPGSGMWVSIEAGKDNWRNANEAWQELNIVGGVVFNQKTGQIEAVGNEEGGEVTHVYDPEKGWEEVGVEAREFYKPGFELPLEAVVDGVTMRISIGLMDEIINRQSEPVTSIEVRRDDASEALGRAVLKFFWRRYVLYVEDVNYETYVDRVKEGGGGVPIAVVDESNEEVNLGDREILDIKPTDPIKVIAADRGLPVKVTYGVGGVGGHQLALLKNSEGGLTIVFRFPVYILEEAEKHHTENGESEETILKSKSNRLDGQIISALATISSFENKYLLEGEFGSSDPDLGVNGGRAIMDEFRDPTIDKARVAKDVAFLDPYFAISQ